jgi:hypothetical protein
MKARELKEGEGEGGWGAPCESIKFNTTSRAYSPCVLTKLLSFRENGI